MFHATFRSQVVMFLYMIRPMPNVDCRAFNACILSKVGHAVLEEVYIPWSSSYWKLIGFVLRLEACLNNKKQTENAGVKNEGRVTKQG